jgi:hypothetical protein
MQMKLFALIMAFPVMSTFGFTRTSNHPDKGKKYPFFYKEGIVVNGNSSEWENSLFNFNKQAQVNYAIVNDTCAFYFCIRIADEAEQMKVFRSGIEIRFNSKGKKKAEATLHFPIGGRTDMGGRMDMGDRRDRKRMHLMFLLQMQDMELTGFKNGVNGFQNIKSGKNGIMAAVNWDSTNVMVYEARVPFSVFAADIRAVTPIAVGIVIKGAQKPRQEQGEGTQEGGQGEMPGGHGQDRPGGMHPGGMGREGQMNGSGDNQKMFEDDEIWQSIVVAKKE